MAGSAPLCGLTAPVAWARRSSGQCWPSELDVWGWLWAAGGATRKGDRWAGVDLRGQCRAVGMRAKVRGGWPGGRALRERIAGFRHSRVAEVGGVCEHRDQGRAWVVVCATGGQVREATREPGPAVDVGKQVGYADRRQVRIQRCERP